MNFNIKNIYFILAIFVCWTAQTENLNPETPFELEVQKAVDDNLWKSPQPIESLKFNPDLENDSAWKNIRYNLDYHYTLAITTLAGILPSVFSQLFGLSSLWPLPDAWLTPYVSRKSINVLSLTMGTASILDMFARFSWKSQEKFPKEFITGCSSQHKGIIAIALSNEDWNGAFNTQLSYLLAEIGDTYPVYFIRLNSRNDLSIGLKNLYDSCELPIKSLIIAGHGAPTRIQMGSSNVLSLDFDIKPLELDRYLDSNASIILQSCLTGSVENLSLWANVAQAFAKAVPGRKVFAPKGLTSVFSLKLDFSGADIKAAFYHFLPSYFLRSQTPKLVQEQTVCYIYSNNFVLTECLNP